jgi:hypothetical protein
MWIMLGGEVGMPTVIFCCASASPGNKSAAASAVSVE